jgi:hypothetical protein
MAEEHTEPEETEEGTLKVPCEVFSRVCGYFSPVSNWHKGKRQEYSERLSFRVPDLRRVPRSSKEG